MRQVTILKGISLKATGMTHKFSPPVTLLDAALWYFLSSSLLPQDLSYFFPAHFLLPTLIRLVKQEGQGVFKLDITFLYENHNGIIFENGKFTEFDEFECILAPYIFAIYKYLNLFDLNIG